MQALKRSMKRLSSSAPAEKKTVMQISAENASLRRSRKVVLEFPFLVKKNESGSRQRSLWNAMSMSLGILVLVHTY